MPSKREYDKHYRETHRAQINEYSRNWYAKNKEKYRAYRLAKFGLSIEDYDNLLKAQNNTCAICKDENAKGPPGSDRLAVDHCHRTGKVRGLLCSACNRLLGRIEDPKGQAALLYLKENQ